MSNCIRCGQEHNATGDLCNICGGEISLTTDNLKTGSLLDRRYEIIKLIKRGGMGSVYKGLDNRFEKIPCAVKEMLSLTYDREQQSYYIDRFKKEANILHNLKHSGLPRVKDYFIEKGRYYLVMDYVEGKDLKTVLESYKGEGIPEDTVIDWAIQILDILEYLHNQSPPIIYRDLKPANIMLKDSDNRLVLIDFGLARTINPDSDSTKTTAGTYAYAPMELFQGKPELRTDLYSLGATMHCLLTGQKPEAPFSFEPVRTLNPSVSKELEDIVMKSLEMEAVNRYKSAEEMKEVLQKLRYSRNEKISLKDSTPSSNLSKELRLKESEKRWNISGKKKFLMILLPLIAIAGIILWSQRSTVSKDYETGKLLMDRKDYKNAILYFNKALDVAPDWSDAQNAKKEALKKYGDEYFNSGNYKEAINCYDASLTIDKNYSDALITKKEALKKQGDEYFNSGNYKEAINCYDASLTIDKNYSDSLIAKKEALKKQGDQYVNSKNYKEALNCYNDSLNIDKTYGEALNGRKKALNKITDQMLSIKNYREVLKYLKEDLKIDTDSSFYIKGIISYKSEEYDRSLEYFNKALKLDPNDMDSLTGKGLTLLRKKDIKRAIECFEKALYINEKDVKALTGKGLALYLDGKYEESINYYEKALKIDPEYADAWNGKGFLLFSQGKYEEALKCYDRALKIKPEEITTLMNRGNTMYAMKNYDEAIECYKKVLKIEPGNKQAWFNHGNALYIMGKYRKAIECYNRALKIDRNYAPAIRARENAMKSVR